MSSEEANVVPPDRESQRVSVVGVGGAGTSILTRAIGVGVSPRRCVAVNKDRLQLSRSPATNKVLLGGIWPGETGGDSNSSLMRSIQVSAHRVRPYTEDSELTIVLTGLGGETGTMTAPLVAQYARTNIRPVVSIVAIPFIHERGRRFIAMRGLKRMTESCDCTVVIDNSVTDGFASPSERGADEKASLAVRALTELVSGVKPAVSQHVLRIMALGPIATVCSSRLKLGENIQASVLRALSSPSANLPLPDTKGAILLHRGPSLMKEGLAAQVYEALVSLIGHEVDFLHGSVVNESDPMVCLFLTGYDYGTTVKAFVDFIENLYDIEYGQEIRGPPMSVQMPLFQME